MPRSAKCSFNLKVRRNSLFWVFISKITCHQRPMFLGKKCRILDAHASQSQKRQQNIGWKIPLIAGHKHLTSPPFGNSKFNTKPDKSDDFSTSCTTSSSSCFCFLCCSFRLKIESKLLINQSKHSKTYPGFSPKKSWYNYTHP